MLWICIFVWFQIVQATTQFVTQHNTVVLHMLGIFVSS